jgi:hypothetical protein
MMSYELLRELMARLDSECPWRSIVAVSRFLPSEWMPSGQMYVLDLAQAEIGDGGYRVVGSPAAIEFICGLPEWHGMTRNEIAACIVWNQLRLWERETGRPYQRMLSEDDLRHGILRHAMRILSSDGS